MSGFSETTHSIAESIVEHSSELHIGIGIISGVLALGCAVYGTIRAVREFDEKKPETTKDKAIIVAKNIGPAVAAEIASVALVIAGAKGMADERNEAVENAAAATISAAMAHEALQRKNEAVKKLDEKTQKEIKEVEAQSALDRHPITKSETTSIPCNNEPIQLFYEPISDRYFKNSRRKVEMGLKRLEERYWDKGCLGVNEYYWELGLREIDSQRKQGWRKDIDGDMFKDLELIPKNTDDFQIATVILGLPVPDDSFWELERLYHNY